MPRPLPPALPSTCARRTSRRRSCSSRRLLFVPRSSAAVLPVASILRTILATVAGKDPQKKRYPWERTEDVVTFATPESIEVSFRAASFGSRVAAALYDVLIL